MRQLTVRLVKEINDGQFYKQLHQHVQHQEWSAANEHEDLCISVCNKNPVDGVVQKFH